MEKVFRYLKQPSTMKGIVSIFGAIGIATNPDQIIAIVAVASAVWGAVEVFRDEDKVQPLGGGDDGQPPKRP